MWSAPTYQMRLKSTQAGRLHCNRNIAHIYTCTCVLRALIFLAGSGDNSRAFIARPTEYISLAIMSSHALLICADLSNAGEFIAAQQALVGETGAASLVSGQCESFCRRVTMLPSLDAIDATKLCRVIEGGPWSGDQKTQLAGMVGARMMQTAPQKGVRRKNQSCMTFERYLSTADVEIIVSAENTLQTKLHCIVDRCIRIGLDLPSEATCGHIIGILVAAGAPELRAQTSKTHECLTDFKKLLKRKFKGAAGEVAVTVFPNTPSELPEVRFASAYGSDAEAPCAQGSLDLAAAPRTMALRRSSAQLRPTFSEASMPANLQQPAMEQQMAPLMAMMAQMVQMVQMARGSSSGHEAGLQLFRPQQRREPAQSPLAIQDGATTQQSPQQDVAKAQQSPQQDVAPAQTPPSATQGSEGTTPVPAQGSQQASPFSMPELSSNLVLQAMQLRAETAAAAEQTEQPKKPKMPKQTKPTKKQQTKQTAMPKAPPKLTEQTKAKAMQTATPKKQVKQTQATKQTKQTKPALGCGKCRHSPNGCARCRALAAFL
jgi:hypothetical protein